MSDSRFLEAVTTPSTSIYKSISWFHLLLAIENQHHLNFRLILATPLGSPSLDLESKKSVCMREEGRRRPGIDLLTRAKASLAAAHATREHKYMCQTLLVTEQGAMF